MRSILQRAALATTASAVALAVCLAAAPLRPATAIDARGAIDVITAAIAERVGPGAEIHVMLQRPEPADFRSAEPDPGAQFGRPMGFILHRAAPGSVATTHVVADVRVIVDHLRARVAIERGHIVADADVVSERSEVDGPLLRRLPTREEVIGARALRFMPAGDLVQSSDVLVRKLVQAGDSVTVIALSGSVEVSAELVAADAGDPGEIIRVVNRATHSYLRARVIRAGLVEVLHVR